MSAEVWSRAVGDLS